MKYTQSIAFTEDFRKPVLISGRDVFGKLEYVKTVEDMKKQADVNVEQCDQIVAQ